MTVHEKAVGATVEWYTPKSLFDALGAPFDLDPACAHQMPCVVPATAHYEELGTVHPWAGHVWLNPPYGPAGVPFIERMISHGDGLMLLPSRTETAIYQKAWATSQDACLLRDRLWFVRDDGYTGRSSFGSTLFAFGGWAAEILRNAGLGVNAMSNHKFRPDYGPVHRVTTVRPAPDHPIWTLDRRTLDYVEESLVGIWATEPDLLIESAIADVREIKKYTHAAPSPALTREAQLVTLIRIGFLDGTDHAERVLGQLNPEYHDLLMGILSAKDVEAALSALGTPPPAGLDALLARLDDPPSALDTEWDKGWHSAIAAVRKGLSKIPSPTEEAK